MFSAFIAVKGQTASAPNDEFLETVWTTEQGLPQNSVNAIIQSRDGYLWLGTFGGLARFDGIKFTTYNSGNTPGLKNNRILSLFEGRDGTIWIGTQSGEVMTFKNGIGKTYTTADGLVNGFVWSVGEDKEGNIWIGNDLAISRFENGRFKTFLKSDGIPDGQVWAIYNSENRHINFLTGNNLVAFDGEKFSSQLNFPEETQKLLARQSLLENGEKLMDSIKTSSLFRKNKYFILQLMSDPTKGQQIWYLEDSGNIFWMGYFWQKGLFYYQNGRFSEYPLNFPIRTMFEDREKNLWLGSNGGGLMRLKKRTLKTLLKENGLPSDFISTVIDDGADGAWLGTTEGLVHWRNGEFKVYTKKDGLASNVTTALCLDRQGGLWIGAGPGLSYYKDGKFKIIFPLDGSIKGVTSALLEDSEGNLWIGSEYGLHVFRDGKINSFHKENGLINDSVRMLKQTSDGAIWIGTIDGLSRWKDGSFTNFTTEQGLSNNYVRDLFEDSDGGLWLATYGGGLNYLKNNEVTSITTNNGLFDDFLSRLLPDDNGNFWLLSNRGIFKINRNELRDFVDGKIKSVSQISFGVADGMKSSEAAGGIQPAGWQTRDGSFWFPTIKGIVVVNPKSPNEIFAPPVVIEQILVDRVVTPLEEKIEINPGQENIEIAYTGLSLSRPEQIRFQYKLENLNDDWINAGTRRTAYYSYIPPGEYLFRVKANNDGVWSQEATLKIIVNPPFWRTRWFLLLTVFAIALVVYGSFRLRILQLQRQNAAQEEFSRRLINAHESERRRIAAELHDSIGQSLATIKNSAIFAVQSVKDLDDAKEQFEEITEESGNAISEVREIAYNLRPHLLDRLGLTKAISSMLNRAADNLHLKMFLQIDDIDGLFESEAELSIYRIIQESLNNIIKHSEATEVRVSIERKENSININIEDNGKGFDTNSQNQSGFGLLGIAERVRMLGGSFVIESEIDQGTKTLINLNLRKG